MKSYVFYPGFFEDGFPIKYRLANLSRREHLSTPRGEPAKCLLPPLASGAKAGQEPASLQEQQGARGINPLEMVNFASGEVDFGAILVGSASEPVEFLTMLEIIEQLRAN